MYIESDKGVVDINTGEYITNVYIVKYLINGKLIESLVYFNLNENINDSCYYLRSLSYKVDQVQIYKNGIIVAELNK